MEWMNISYVLAFLAVFVASVSQILLKQSAEIEHKNILFKFLYKKYFNQQTYRKKYFQIKTKRRRRKENDI